MKRIILVVMFFFLLAGSCILGGCEGSDFMDAKDKQPRASLTTFKTAPTDLTGGVVSFFQEYAFRRELYTDPMTLVRMTRDIPLYPLSVNRFDLTIQSHHINQEFGISVRFPLVGFGSYKVIMKDPLHSVLPVYTSNHGRGPGGSITAGVAVWAPIEGIPLWQYEDYGWPIGTYTLDVIVTDADGLNAFTSINYSVQKVIIETIDLDKEE